MSIRLPLVMIVTVLAGLTYSFIQRLLADNVMFESVCENEKNRVSPLSVGMTRCSLYS